MQCRKLQIVVYIGVLHIDLRQLNMIIQYIIDYKHNVTRLNVTIYV